MKPYLERPDWVRRLNQFGPAVGGAAHVIPLLPEELLASAREATGLYDVGDALFEETFRRRIESVHR